MAFSTNGASQIWSNRRMKSNIYFSPCAKSIKNGSKVLLKIRNTRNLENIGNIHKNIGMGKDLMIRKTTNSTGTDPSVNRWDNMKIKSFGLSMETVRAHRHPQNGREFVSATFRIGAHTYDLARKWQKLNSKKIKLTINQWANELNRHFVKRETEMANKHSKKCPRSQKCHMEMQIKSTWKYYLIQGRMAALNKADNKCWRKYEEKEILIHCWWIRRCKLIQPL